MNRILSQTAFALWVASATTVATARPLIIDPGWSHIAFTIDHMVVMSLDGEFRIFDGSIDLGDDITASTVSFSVDVASISTDSEKRDEHLKTADFFDVAKFPRATFKSSRVERASDGSLRLTGDLTIRGTTKPIDFRLVDEGVHEGRHAYSATATLNRTDFGVGESSLMIGDELELSIKLATN